MTLIAAVGTAVQLGCNRDCLTAEQTEVLELAARGDAERLRVLVEADPKLARAQVCPPPATLTERVSRKILRPRAGTLAPLHVAARQGHTDAIRVLLEHGAEVDVRDVVANTPLHLAAQYDHLEAARALLAAGADPHVRRTGDLTPLHLAAGHGSFRVAKLLLEHGADVNAREGGDWTPLHRAASGGHANVARLLLGRGADVNARDRNGAPALNYAVLNHHEAVVELLLERGADADATGEASTPLTVAVASVNLDGVRRLLATGADPNQRDGNGRTAIELAIRPSHSTAFGDERDREILELLLRAGADPRLPSEAGKTGLHSAAAADRGDLVEVLLDHGAPVEARNEWGWTPLFYAATQHHHEVVDLLLRRGADPNAADGEGRTVLDHVWGDEQMEALIRRYGGTDARERSKAEQRGCFRCAPSDQLKVVVRGRQRATLSAGPDRERAGPVVPS